MAPSRKIPGSALARRLAAVGTTLLALNPAGAAPVNPNNILVSVQRSVREFTPAGSLVQIIPFNYGGRAYPGNPGIEGLRDIAVDQYGWIDSFNGYWNPFLTRYSPVSNTFTHKTFPGWSTINGGTGGLAAYQGFVFATDINTIPGTENGIVRFDVFNNSVARFAAGIDFNDLNIGLNGKLYAVSSSQADIYVYEPKTMRLLNHIVKPPNVDWIEGVAADKTGQIFIASRNGTVSRLDSSGVLQTSRATGFTYLLDIDIDETGRLILSQWNGNVLVGDASLLNDFSSFLASDNNGGAQDIFVCFAHPVPLPVGQVYPPPPTPAPTPTPTPTHDILVSLGHKIGGYGISRENSLREFTLDGLLLRSIRFNYNGGPYPNSESLRAIVVDHNGVINAFNGTFSPLLTRFSWNCSSFTHTSFPGLSITNNITGGGIAAYQNFIFMPDESTAGAGEPSGIVRFDTSNNTAARFFSGSQFGGLIMGLDGKLYAFPDFAGIDVYDPTTLQLLKHLTVPPNVEGGKITVDQNGTIFMASGYGTIYRLDNNMVLQASSATGFPDLVDIEVDETGRIVAVSDEGWVVVGDSSLNGFSWFRAIDDPDMSEWMISVAFAPLAPAPPVQLLSVVSEKTQGLARTFDIDLPVDGPRGVECRSGGPAGDYSMIFTFAHALLQVGGVCSSKGTVSGAAIDPDDPHRYVVNLTGVTNATYVLVTLNGLNGSEGTYSETVSQEMGILLGDTVGNGWVNSADFSQTRGQPVTILNFRQDVNADGVIDNEDLKLVKSKSGTALPSSP